MDIIYTLIDFTLGLIVIAIVVGIQIITGGLTTGIEVMVGMLFYPILYNIYQSVYNQLPSNVTKLQAAVNHSFQNYVNYVSQVQNYVIAVNTLAMILEIIAVIGAFIILLELLMRLAMPRDGVRGAGGY